MSVILPPEQSATWLAPETPEAQFVTRPRPYPADAMQVTEVGPAVNSPRNDGPECLDAARPPSRTPPETQRGRRTCCPGTPGPTSPGCTPSGASTPPRREGGNPVPTLLAAQARWPGEFRLAFALGMWYLNREPQRAAGHFRAAWTLRPDNVATAPNLGNSLHRSGEPAAVVLREATRLGPTFAVAHRNLGNALREAGDLDGAVRSCREAVRLDPEHPVARYNLGIVLARQKDPDGAIGDMTSLVDWGPASDRRFSSQPPDGRAPGVGGVAPVFEQLRPPAVQFRRVATQAAGLAEQAVWHVGRVLDDRRDRRLRPRRVAVPADRTMATVRNGVWAGPVAPRWSRPDHLVVVRLRTPTLAESGSSRCGPTRAGGTEGHPGHIHDRRGAHRTDPAAIQRTPPP